jgi:hypothetical protein
MDILTDRTSYEVLRIVSAMYFPKTPEYESVLNLILRGFLDTESEQ